MSEKPGERNAVGRTQWEKRSGQNAVGKTQWAKRLGQNALGQMQWENAVGKTQWAKRGGRRSDIGRGRSMGDTSGGRDVGEHLAQGIDGDTLTYIQCDIEGNVQAADRT